MSEEGVCVVVVRGWEADTWNEHTSAHMSIAAPRSAFQNKVFHAIKS